MTELEAARFLIVAWVKDWHLRNYARHVTGNMNFDAVDVPEFAKKYKFMSDHFMLYCRGGTGINMRRYVCDYLPAINDALWDRYGDTKKLLELSTKVVKLKCIDEIIRSKEAVDARSNERKARANQLSAVMYKEHRERCNAKGWNIVK